MIGFGANETWPNLAGHVFIFKAGGHGSGGDQPSPIMLHSEKSPKDHGGPEQSRRSHGHAAAAGAS
jgi:hypothetical protein